MNNYATRWHILFLEILHLEKTPSTFLKLTSHFHNGAHFSNFVHFSALKFVMTSHDTMATIGSFSFFCHLGLPSYQIIFDENQLKLLTSDQHLVIAHFGT